MRIIGPNHPLVYKKSFCPLFHINKSDVVVANADARWCHLCFRKTRTHKLLLYILDDKWALNFAHYTCSIPIQRPRMLGQKTIRASHSLPTSVFLHSLLAQAKKTKAFVASKRYHLIISAYTYLKRICRWLDENGAKYNGGAGVGAGGICGGGSSMWLLYTASE